MLSKIDRPLAKMLGKSSHIIVYDFIRIICAAMIFLRHSITMYGVRYSTRLTLLGRNSTSLIMMCFFILSGISVNLSTKKKPLVTRADTIGFYKKRLMALLPSYILLHILYMLIIDNQMENGLQLFPVTLTITQSGYHTLFGIFNFGGTWFIGCLAICYFVFPLVSSLIRPIKLRWKLLLFAFVIAMHYYGTWVINTYKLTGAYDHPLYRFSQFLIGFLLAEILNDFSEYANGKYRPIPFLILTAGLLALLVIILRDHDWFYAMLLNGNQHLPVLLVILGFFYYIRIPLLDRSRVIRYLSKLTYEVYLLQMLAWQISRNILGNEPTNDQKKWTCIAVTLVLSILAKALADLIRMLINRIGKKREKFKLDPEKIKADK